MTHALHQMGEYTLLMKKSPDDSGSVEYVFQTVN